MQDEYERAREDLDVAIAEEPDDASLREALGMACMMSEQFDAAREAFDKAIELDPDAAGPLLQRARVFAVEGEREKALADIDRAVDLAPRDPSARLLRARILQQAGQSERALADVESVLQQDAEMPAALELKGLIAAERQDYPEAIRSFRKLAAKNPDDPIVLSQLGTLYLAAKQPREAIRRFTKALEADGEAFAALRGRSDAEISIGDHVAAIADLEKAHTIKPDDTGILNNLAWLLATSPNDAIRDAARAITLAEKACEETEWKEGHIISTLAAGHAEKGDFESAQKFSRKAIDADTAAGGDVEDQLKNELANYEAGKPWRERQEMPEGGDAAKPDDEAIKPAKNEPAEPAATAAKDRKPRRPFDE
jgi:tetratricopeptide (TPR) repeat protein